MRSFRTMRRVGRSVKGAPVVGQLVRQRRHPRRVHDGGAAGNERKLSELVADDPVLLQFYRGWWCPKKQVFFQNLVTLQAEAEVAYTRFISVSVDPPEVQAAFRAGIDVPEGPLAGVNRSTITAVMTRTDAGWRIRAFHNTLVAT